LIAFRHGSKTRLTRYDLARFPGDTLFDRVGRVVCEVGRLPRKELYEAWEVARRVRRWCRGGRVIDVAGGHGLLAHLMLLLDDSSPGAIVVDPSPSMSGPTLHEALATAWPRLERRVNRIGDRARPVRDGRGRSGRLESRLRGVDGSHRRCRHCRPGTGGSAPLLPRSG
jgi:hypothetical protein